MKMKCFHYPQSFTLIIKLKFNFQYSYVLTGINFRKMSKLKLEYVVHMLFFRKIYQMKGKKARKLERKNIPLN